MSDLYQIDGTKIASHPQRVAQWLDAGDDIDELAKVAPLYVEISPVGQCSHRCIFCSVDYIGYQRRQLRLDGLGPALRDMASMGVKSVMFAGEGEPLLHPLMSEITVTAADAGLDTAFTTNGTSLTHDFIDQCLRDISWIKVSINGGTPEVYAQVHQTKKKDFQRVIDNLTYAVQHRKQFGAQCTLGAQMVLLPENVETGADLAEICHDIGLDYLVIKPYSQNPHSTETAARGIANVTPEDWAWNFERVKKFETETFKVICRARTMANYTSNGRAYEVCNATPFFWSYIMATGDVYGCSAHLLDPRFCFGNINQQSFKDIWTGQKRRDCIKMMRNFDLGVCRKNCRMEFVNQYLWSLKNPAPHVNFI